MKRREWPAIRHLPAGIKLRTNPQGGVTLTELVCVLAIIAILAALYLPSIAHAYLKVKRFFKGW